MRLSKAWIVAVRDFKIFSHQRYVWYTLILFPVLISIIFPVVIEFAASRSGAAFIPRIPMLLDAFSIFLIIGAAFVPVSIATYTIVGEKVEKSLEPLLATPLTDGEILLGKTLSAFIPTLVAMSIGGIVYMIGMDIVTYPMLNYYYFPNWNIAVILLILMPAAIVMSVEFSVIVSSRVNDVRSAMNLGIVMFFPFMAIYIASEIGLITLDTNTILLIAGGIFVADVALFFLSTALFKREEILTKWK
jgi:ABC-2 type transport system permease protein